MRFNFTNLLHRALVAIGPSRHFAAAQQSVAIGGIATVLSHLTLAFRSPLAAPCMARVMIFAI